MTIHVFTMIGYANTFFVCAVKEETAWKKLAKYLNEDIEQVQADHRYDGKMIAGREINDSFRSGVLLA